MTEGSIVRVRPRSLAARIAFNRFAKAYGFILKADGTGLFSIRYRKGEKTARLSPDQIAELEEIENLSLVRGV